MSNQASKYVGHILQVVEGAPEVDHASKYAILQIYFRECKHASKVTLMKDDTLISVIVFPYLQYHA